MPGRFERLLRGVDAVQRRRVWLSLPVAVARKMSDDGGGSLAAQIGYYGFLSVFPLLLAFAAVLGFVLAGHPGLKESVVHTTERSFPALSDTINASISGNSVALGVGLVGALWAGLGVTRATERAMNDIWNVPLPDRPGLWRSRLRGLGMLCILGATFLVSTFLAALRTVGGGVRPLALTLGTVGPPVLNFALYLLAFQVLTERRLAWRTLVPGAAVGAIGWTLLEDLGAYLVRHTVAHASHLYGSLAAVVGLLVWIYLGAQLTLYAAELNVVLAHRLWPRSLTRGSADTDGDRRARALRVEGAGAATSVVPAESIDGLVGEDLLEHLRALERYRRELEVCGDERARAQLRRAVRAEAAEAARALDSLLLREPELAAAWRDARRPGGGTTHTV